MHVQTACVDTLNITIFHNGKTFIDQQFITSYAVYYAYIIILYYAIH